MDTSATGSDRNTEGVGETVDAETTVWEQQPLTNRSIAYYDPGATEVTTIIRPDEKNPAAPPPISSGFSKSTTEEAKAPSQVH